MPISPSPADATRSSTPSPARSATSRRIPRRWSFCAQDPEAHHARERGVFPRLHAAHAHRPRLPGGDRGERRHGQGRTGASRSAGPRRISTKTAFDEPREVRLDRKPNPHLSFGFGTHLCLGAPHARLILRTLLRLCCERVKGITILDARGARRTRGRL